MSGLGQPQMAPVLQSSPTARPMGQPLGYARVSTTDQRPDSQADALTAGTDTPPGRDLRDTAALRPDATGGVGAGAPAPTSTRYVATGRR